MRITPLVLALLIPQAAPAIGGEARRDAKRDMPVQREALAALPTKSETRLPQSVRSARPGAPPTSPTPMRAVSVEMPERSSEVGCVPLRSLPPSELETLVHRIAAEEEFHPELAAAIIRWMAGHPAGDQPTNQGVLTTAGEAIDVVQHAQRMTEQCSPDIRIRSVVADLKQLAARYRNPVLLLAAFHAGETAVLSHRGIPPDRDTLTFIADILTTLAGDVPEVESNRDRSASTIAGSADDRRRPAHSGAPRAVTPRNTAARSASNPPAPSAGWLVLHVE